MKRYHLLLLAVASAPLLIHAQTARTSAAATDASVAVPQLKYQSAFAQYKPAAAPPASPDKVWILSNQEVAGQPDGASDYMPMGMNHAPVVQDKPATVPAAQDKPATVPAAQDKPAAGPAADPHQGHNMHMKGQ